MPYDIIRTHFETLGEVLTTVSIERTCSRDPTPVY
jgi:hypothetical protein